MAYNIHVYVRPDSNIEYITVQRLDTGETIEVNQDTVDSDYYEKVIENVVGTAIVKAFPYSGYKFSQFVYRDYSYENPQQTSNRNPFYFSGYADLYIRAEAEPISSDSIAEFDWEVSNGSATAEQTQKAYNALVTRGKLKDFSYLVWNDMVDKLSEVMQAEKVSWGDASKAKMTSTDRKMTADRFNAFGLGMVNYGISTWESVSKGDPIIADRFIVLIDRLNRYIKDFHQ